MAATSTVPTARAALFARIDAAPALAAVQRSYSHPGDAMERETIYLGDARGRHDQALIKVGRRTRDETYTIDVWIETTAEGPNAQPAFERAFTLKAAVEDILADDPTIGLGQPFWASAADFDAITGWDEDRRGHATRIRVAVECRGRLT